MKPDALRKLTDSLAKYANLPLEELQKKVFEETGDKPCDLLVPGPGLEMRAKRMGARLCLLELKQQKAREIVAELRRRYERDCYLAKLEPVRVWEADVLDSILGSGQDAASQEPSSEAGSTEPPASGHSSPQSQQPS